MACLIVNACFMYVIMPCLIVKPKANVHTVDNKVFVIVIIII